MAYLPGGQTPGKTNNHLIVPSVFISRVLKPASPFHQLDDSWRVQAQSLLQFTVVPVAEFPEADWYFFYSSRGARFLLQQGIPAEGVRLACLGTGSAEVLKAAGYIPDFVGNGNHEQTAQQWLPMVSGQRVLFVQARHSRASVQQLLGPNIHAKALVVYDNAIRTDFSIPPTDYLIFTSPLNFQAYCRKYPIAQNHRLIGIGPTTAVTFSAASVKEYRIAETPSEAGLLKCLLDWEAESPVEKEK